MQQNTKPLPSLWANLRLRHFSLRTEEAYVAWARRCVRFLGLRHPRSTTMIYTHVLNRGGMGVESPADLLAGLPQR